MLQTGDYDYAWNLQVEDELLTRLERSGRGRLVVTPTAHVEHILLNLTDPWREIEGERSSLKAPHPILGDPLVRRALGLLVDRATIASEIYGRFGSPTGNILNGPAPFVSPNVRWAFDPAGAESALETAGWRRGPASNHPGRPIRSPLSSAPAPPPSPPPPRRWSSRRRWPHDPD